MAKARRDKGGGRTTPKGTRPAGFQPRPTLQQRRGGSLLQDARVALNDPSPMATLGMATALVDLCTPSLLDSDDDRAARPDLMKTMLALADSEPELTAVAAVAGHLVANPEIADVILAGAYQGRLPRRFPDWIRLMGLAKSDGVLRISHPFNDGEDFVVGVRWPGGEAISAIIYIDHNAGTIIKDAFLVPDRPQELRARLTDIQEEGVEITDTSPADARAKIAGALANSALTLPVPTESWPQSSSIVEWMIGLLPEGGTGYSSAPISAGDSRTLIDDFLASPYSPTATVDEASTRSLVEPLIAFASESGGDPLRVSPITVEIVLTDWYLRSTDLPFETRMLLPTVLRHWIRYAQQAAGLAPSLIEQTLLAVGEWEHEYATMLGHLDPGDEPSA